MTSPDSRTGVLLLNVGTPDAPTPEAVRRYLAEFLGDPRVLDIPAIPRWLLLNGVILRTRPKQSAHAYQQVWTDGGSPLLVFSRQMETGLQAALGDRYEVRLAMSYGNPSIPSAFDHFRSRGIDRIVLFPLYPQYASATTGTSLAACYRLASGRWNTPYLSVVPPFYEDAGMIETFAEIGRPILDAMKADHVLFSFHGLPTRQVRKSDESGGGHCLKSDWSCCATIVHANRNCYRAQCAATARALAAKLGLRDGAWTMTFQSRLGKEIWVEPYTDVTVEGLPKRGVRRLAAFSPAFVADCLETIEEIGMRAKESFLANGGEEFRLIPSLNGHPRWIETAARLVRSTAP
jgi:ferrochelatase